MRFEHAPPRGQATNPGRAARGPLLTGGLAAILASACCVGPLLLLTVGISGAWIGHLVALEPYQPLFIAFAVGALFLAWRRLWRPAAKCAPGEVCAVAAVGRTYKAIFTVVALLTVVAVVFPYLAPWFY